MRVLDSRRLTGASLWLDRPGALLEVALADSETARAAAAWSRHARRALEAVGWTGESLTHRGYPGGVQLALTAPIDRLYLATDLNEWAWARTASELDGAETGTGDDGLEKLKERANEERNPALIALAAAAGEHGVTFLSDTRRASVGLGSGSRAWPLDRIPSNPARVRWIGLHDIPVALVTGTNGKTTTVRLVGAMARAAGITAGVTSTDRVDVGDETVAVGDYSGPNGARTVLRDRRVQLAALEVARGGILRRGLPLPVVDAALVTNIANDHMGEFGIFDLDALADAKMVVAKAVKASGRVVLNADDARLLARGQALGKPVTWFTLDPEHPVLASHLGAGGDACVLEDGALVLRRGATRHAITTVGRVPVAFGGAARYNVANALGAVGLAAALGLPLDAITSGLERFQGTPGENPGRANTWEVDGVRVIVDFAHNPHGLAALAEMVAALPAARRGVVIGQAGDRDDASIAEFARAAWAIGPDRVFIKEMEKFLRGRARGVVPAMIEQELLRAGAAPAALSHHDDELAAVKAALAWARPGDVLLLTVHAEREAVITLIQAAAARCEMQS